MSEMLAGPKQATEIDRGVGVRICALRKAHGMSQTDLGAAIGVTFQQVQKYEKGTNRVGAGRLSEIAQLLRVPVSTFFDEADATADGLQPDVFNLLSSPGAMDILRAFDSIKDEEIRREVLSLVRNASRLASGPTTVR